MLANLFSQLLNIRLCFGDSRSSHISFDFDQDLEEYVLRHGETKLLVKQEYWQNQCKWIIQLANTGSKPLFIESIRIKFEADAGHNESDWRVFIDAGMCAWCGVKKLEALDHDPGFQLVPDQQFREPREIPEGRHRSSMQTVLYAGNTKSSWLFGFLSQRNGYNGIDIIPKKQDNDQPDFLEAWQILGRQINPGEMISVDPLILQFGEDPIFLLENYARLVQNQHDKLLNHPPVVGMMTWYGYRTAIDEKIVIENSKLVAELFGGYPQAMQKIMLLDHGWTVDANWGDWSEADPLRFPNGIQWLSNQLNKDRLQLGLWYTPFCITNNAPNYNDLSSLRAKNALDELYINHVSVFGHLPGHAEGLWPINFLDGGKKQVQEKWVNDLSNMSEKFSCVYWKLDFFALLSSAKTSLSNPIGDLYARTYDNFRSAVGAKGHLAPCSGDTNIHVGYADSMRIAADIGNAGHWPKEMPVYARGLNTVAALWYKNRRFWVNDADSVQIGCGCGLNEARIRATMVAFSGGHFFVSEDLRTISQDRIEIVRRLLPAYPHAAQPIDLFDHVYPVDIPRIWKLNVESDWGAANALAVFNLTEEPITQVIDPEWFGNFVQKEFLVLEWWMQRWLGNYTGSFEVHIPPGEVMVLHAGIYKTHPWILSTSHHHTGAWIIENVRFDHLSNELKGDIVTKPGLKLSLNGTVPPGWSIPIKSDFHTRMNGQGGWSHDLITTSERTPFTIAFAQKE